MPIELTLDNGGITPPQVAVPGFLALELIVHNELPVEVVVRLEGAKPIAVGPGETGAGRGSRPEAGSLHDRRRRGRQGAARHRRRPWTVAVATRCGASSGVKWPTPSSGRAAKSA